MAGTRLVAREWMVLHALNRCVGRMKLFSTERDEMALEETIEEALRLDPMRAVGCSVQPAPKPRPK